MKMKKFINNPENLTPELLEGFAMAHKDLVTLGENRMVINNKLAAPAMNLPSADLWERAWWTYRS